MSTKKKPVDSTSVPHPQQRSTSEGGTPTRVDGKARPAAGTQGPGTADQQMEQFAQAYRELRDRKFARAKELFALAVNGPQRQISHNARLHMLMCERRMEKPALNLESPDDHYNYAIERINARDLQTACSHLLTALSMNSQADHVYYALAVCRGLEGDMPGAYENLRRAIEIEPRNRVAARQDADFAPIAHQSPLEQLLYPEKSPF